MVCCCCLRRVACVTDTAQYPVGRAVPAGQAIHRHPSIDQPQAGRDASKTRTKEGSGSFLLALCQHVHQDPRSRAQGEALLISSACIMNGVQTVADSFRKLAEVYGSLGQYTDAEAAMRRSAPGFMTFNRSRANAGLLRSPMPSTARMARFMSATLRCRTSSTCFPTSACNRSVFQTHGIARFWYSTASTMPPPL